MTYFLEKKQPETFQRKKEKRLRIKKAKADSRRTSFDQDYALRRQSDDPLASRSDKSSNTSTVSRIRSQKTLSRNYGSPRLLTTTPRARELEKKFHGAQNYREGFISVSDLMSLNEETSELEKRCIADVMGKPAKGPDGKPVKGPSNRLSRAYAICRASLQKSGRIKKGTAEMTKKGRGISGSKSKADDHKSKVSSFEKHVVAARNK